MNEIKLGAKVIHEISEFTGIVTSKVEYLNGPTRHEVTAKSVDGKPGETIWAYASELKVAE